MKKICLEEGNFKLKKIQLEYKEKLRIRKLIALEQANKILKRKAASFEKYAKILSTPHR